MSQTEIDAIFDDWDRRVRQKSRKEGGNENLQRALVNLYEARLGSIPEALRAAIAANDDLEMLQHWVTLFGTSSAEEIAAAVLGPGSANGAC
jgi:hypothetical protein